MQLIPFVFILFFILSMAISSMQKEGKQELLLTERMLKHLHLETQLLEKSNTVVLETMMATSKTSSSKKKSKGSFHNNRLVTAHARNSRLSLSLLYREQNPTLYQLALDFLTLLYKNEPRIHPKELLDELLHKGKVILKADPQRKSFSVFDLPEPSKNLKRAIQGTKAYDFTKNVGYPMLDDFIYLYGETTKHAIVVRHASEPLLLTLLGKKCTDWILEKEEEKEDYLYLKELKTLLAKKGSPLPDAYLPLLSDAKFQPQQKGTKKIVVIDPNLQLEVRQTLHTYPLEKLAEKEATREQTRSTPDALIVH